MPVEIRELVIRVVAQSSDREEARADETELAPDRQALIQECVREVLRILKRTEER